MIMETREIKFRAISEETDDMRYGSLTVEYDGTCHINWWTSLCIEPENNYYEPAPFMEVVRKETIGQFTGLTDKNGKEIYEGDVLKVCNGSINGTPWMENLFVVEYKINKGYNTPMYCWDEIGNSQMNSTCWCEVIGNIHENPELL